VVITSLVDRTSSGKQGQLYLYLHNHDIRLASVADFRTRFLPSTSLITASVNLFRLQFRHIWEYKAVTELTLMYLKQIRKCAQGV